MGLPTNGSSLSPSEGLRELPFVIFFGVFQKFTLYLLHVTLHIDAEQYTLFLQVYMYIKTSLVLFV